MAALVDSRCVCTPNGSCVDEGRAPCSDAPLKARHDDLITQYESCLSRGPPPRDDLIQYTRRALRAAVSSQDQGRGMCRVLDALQTMLDSTDDCRLQAWGVTSILDMVCTACCSKRATADAVCFAAREDMWPSCTDVRHLVLTLCSRGRACMLAAVLRGRDWTCTLHASHLPMLLGLMGAPFRGTRDVSIWDAAFNPLSDPRARRQVAHALIVFASSMCIKLSQTEHTPFVLRAWRRDGALFAAQVMRRGVIAAAQHGCLASLRAWARCVRGQSSMLAIPSATLREQGDTHESARIRVASHAWTTVCLAAGEYVRHCHERQGGARAGSPGDDAVPRACPTRIMCAELSGVLGAAHARFPGPGPIPPGVMTCIVRQQCEILIMCDNTVAHGLQSARGDDTQRHVSAAKTMQSTVRDALLDASWSSRASMVRFRRARRVELRAERQAAKRGRWTG